jgi:hypothetical protein
MSSGISNVATIPAFGLFTLWSAVNGVARLALSPGFSGQPKIEPGGDEEKKHSKNNMAKLKGKSAQRDLQGWPTEIALRPIITKQRDEDTESDSPKGA